MLAGGGELQMIMLFLAVCMILSSFSPQSAAVLAKTPSPGADVQGEVRESAGGWFACGYLSLPPPYSPATITTRAVTLTRIHDEEKNSGQASKDVTIPVQVLVRDGRRLFCSCDGGNGGGDGGRSTVQAHAALMHVEVDYGGGERVNVSAPIMLSCSASTVAVCRQQELVRDLASADLLVSPAIRARLVAQATHHNLQISPAVFTLQEPGRSHRRAMTKLQVDRAVLMGVADSRDETDTDTKCFEYAIKLRTPFSFDSLSARNPIVVVQSIPFDKCSCDSRLTPSLGVMSLIQLADQTMHNKHPLPAVAHNTIHAPHQDGIHGLGRSAALLVETMRGLKHQHGPKKTSLSPQPLHQRELTKANLSPQPLLPQEAVHQRQVRETFLFPQHPPPRGEEHQRETRETNTALQPPPSGVTELSLRENTPLGTVVDTVQLLEGETEVSYSITTSNTPFIIDSNTGVITIKSNLDRETMALHTFQVSMSVSNTVIRSTCYQVTVLDANDNTPTFLGPTHHEVPLPKDTVVGSVVDDVFVEDEDVGSNAILDYHLLNNTANTFSLTPGLLPFPSHALLSLARPLDYEVSPEYHLTVLVRDRGKPALSSLATIIVRVQDMPEPQPEQRDNTSVTVRVEEGVAGGSPIYQVRTDVDVGSSDHVTYSLVEGGAGLFEVDLQTGIVRLQSGQSLDYETTPTNYTLTVSIEDESRRVMEETQVTIVVLDINDNPPIFDSRTPLTVDVCENQPPYTPIFNVSASDADSAPNAGIQYYLSGDSRVMKTFEVGSSTGQVFTLRELDREDRAWYQLTIVAVDSGFPVLTSTSIITVQVTDVLDDPPIFSQDMYSTFITEPRPLNTTLLSIVATTRDAVLHPDIQYRLVAGNDTLFAVGERGGEDGGGVVLAAMEIDPVIHAGQYMLRVAADYEEFSSEVSIDITVAMDTGNPALRPLTIYHSVYPTLFPSPAPLGAVRVIQPSTQSHTFSLASSTPSNEYFRIDPSSGLISTFSNVTSGLHTLNVSVSAPSAPPSAWGHGVITVNIVLVSNATLESAVGVVFPDVSEELLVSALLQPFLEFVATSLSTTQQHVEVLSIQGVEQGVELVLAVRESRFQSYIPANLLEEQLQLAAVTGGGFPHFPSFRVADNVCSSSMCPHFQTCHTLFHLHRAPSGTGSHPFRTLVDAASEVVYNFHPFTHSHRCVCPQGYNRTDLCTSEVNECDPSPCYFGAECVNEVGGYRCLCPSGTTGENCSIVCPSDSCLPCDPSPCRNGGMCISRSVTGRHLCNNCPSPLRDYPQHVGPNCELASVHFTSVDAFVAVPIVAITTSLNLSVQFSTISHSGLLLYGGRRDRQGDYVSVELLIGQVKVGVSFGGVATELMTQSERGLNDGVWHQVDLIVQDRVVVVTVAGCSEVGQPLAASCFLQSPLHPLDHRILEFTTPLYLGGVEPHIALESSPLSTVRFDGCLSQLYLNRELQDFSSPLVRRRGTQPGCPPMNVSCPPECERCEPVWNATLCSCETTQCRDPINIRHGGYVLLKSSPINIRGALRLYIRTRTPQAVLIDLGGIASLELQHGSVVFRRGYNITLDTRGNNITLEARAQINDGRWHDIHLIFTRTNTTLSIDNGRVSAVAPEDGSFQVTNIALGGATDGRGSFEGCVSTLIVNLHQTNLSALLDTRRDSVFNATLPGVVRGCNLDNLCTPGMCPAQSSCDSENQMCTCDDRFLASGNRCIDTPCSQNYCQNGGSCMVTMERTGPSPSPTPSCTCNGGYSGEQCEVAGCGVGFGGQTCRRCGCDPRGVAEDVCDPVTSECVCKAGVNVFSVSGDLGCVPCDCHPEGARSGQCNDMTGQCLCRENVTGRRCDTCQTGTAGLDEQGCRAATEVLVSVVLLDVRYEAEFQALSSSPMPLLLSSLSSGLETRLYQYGLSGIFQVSSLPLSNSSGNAGVDLKVSNYLPRDSSPLLRPSVVSVAGILQVALESGRVGAHRISASVPRTLTGSLNVTACPEGSRLDGIICRAPLQCSGRDVDGDSVPDACDSCSYVFNPDQTNQACQPLQGVCPAGVAAGILWSATSKGTSDRKPCPLPLIGFTSRPCGENGSWEEADLVGCISMEGQVFLNQISALERGQILSFAEFSSVASAVASIARRFQGSMPHPLVGGDVQVVGRLLSQLVNQLVALTGFGTEGGQLLETFTTATSDLLNPDLSSAWRGVVEGVEFDSEDFLLHLEAFSLVVARQLLRNATDPRLVRDNLLITTVSHDQSHDMSRDPFVITFNRTRSVASIEASNTTLMLTFGLFPTLGDLLPIRSQFNISQMTIATPILSVQAMETGGSEVTDVSVSLTLPYRQPVTRVVELSKGVCASWTFGENGGWSSRGCVLVEANVTAVTCKCSHLTAFAVFLPLDAFEAVPPPIRVYHPSIGVYVVLGLVGVVYVVALVLLLFISTLEGLTHSVNKHLVLSLLLSTLLFIATIDRTEDRIVCGVLGVVLVLVFLCPIGWMLADIILVARFLVPPPPKPKFIILLYIIGWGVPVLMGCIAVGVTVGIKQSFHQLFQFPSFCWLTSDVVWAFVVPAILLLIVYVVVYVFNLMTLCRLMANHETTMNTRKIRIALSVSVTVMILYLVGVVMALLTLYSTDEFEYGLAIVQAAMAVFIFCAHCLNQTMRESMQERCEPIKDADSGPIDYPAGIVGMPLPPPPEDPPEPPSTLALERLPTLRSMGREPTAFQRQLAILSEQSLSYNAAYNRESSPHKASSSPRLPLPPPPPLEMLHPQDTPPKLRDRPSHATPPRDPTERHTHPFLDTPPPDAFSHNVVHHPLATPPQHARHTHPHDKGTLPPSSQQPQPPWFSDRTHSPAHSVHSNSSSSSSDDDDIDRGVSPDPAHHDHHGNLHQPGAEAAILQQLRNEGRDMLDVQEVHGEPPRYHRLAYRNGDPLPSSMMSVEHTVSNYSESVTTSCALDREILEDPLDLADLQHRAEQRQRVGWEGPGEYPMEPVEGRGGSEVMMVEGPHKYLNYKDVLQQGGISEERGEPRGHEDPLWYQQRDTENMEEETKLGEEGVELGGPITPGMSMAGVEGTVELQDRLHENTGRPDMRHQSLANQSSNDSSFLEDDLFPLPYETPPGTHPPGTHPPANGNPPSHHPMAFRPLPLSPLSQDDDWWSGTVPTPSSANPPRGTVIAKPQLNRLGKSLSSDSHLTRNPLYSDWGSRKRKFRSEGGSTSSATLPQERGVASLPRQRGGKRSVHGPPQWGSIEEGEWPEEGEGEYYHSKGPCPEANKLPRHADKAETMQSLV